MADQENLNLKVRDESSTSFKTLVTRSSCKSKNLLEMKEALDEMSQILNQKEEILKKKMAILEEIANESSESSIESFTAEDKQFKLLRVDQWVSGESAAQSAHHSGASEKIAKCPSSSAPPAGDIENKPRTENGCVQPQQTSVAGFVNAPETSKLSDPNTSSDIQRLAEALQYTIQSAVSFKDKKLPIFEGSPKDWLQFKASYDETTQQYKVKPAENLRRLRLALKGEAKSAVAALLHSCSDPETVIATLELRFGHPTRIVKDQISELKQLRVVSSTDSQDLSVFACKVNNCVAIIQALKLNDYLHSSDLYECIVQKMNSQLRVRWMDYAAANAAQDMGVLVCAAAFLRREAEMAQKFLPEGGSASAPRQAAAPAPRTHTQRYSVHAATKGQSTSTCSFCNDSSHNITTCAKFIELSVSDRYAWIKDNKKCFRCILYSHPGRNCKISKYLHKLLREPKSEAPLVQDGMENVDTSVGINNTTSPSPVFTAKALGAILKVVPITLHVKHLSVKTFALLDEGASISLVDESLVNLYGQGLRETVNIQGIGTAKQTIYSHKVAAKIENSTGSQFDINLRTMKDLNLQSQHLEKANLLSYAHVKEVEHLIHWYVDATPRVLIGQDNWHLIVSRKLYAGALDEPVVSETLLGLVVHGNAMCARRSQLSHTIQIAHVQAQSADDELHALVKESFELDSIGVKPQERTNPKVERALNILNTTTKKIDGNTWETGLLWAEHNKLLPNSGKSALNRFFSLEKKLQKDDKLAKAYSAQMNRLFDLGFAELYNKATQGDQQGWVLPHFAAINPNKPKKVRIVFDCANKIQGVSLNDHLLSGPDLLQSLLSVLWKFRQAPVAMAADIKDMFLKIKIREEDQKFQQFYWREPGDSSPPRLHVMTSMLFGATCSPSAAIFVKNRNAEGFKDKYPEAACAIEKNHYMDDYLDSCQTEDDAIEITSNIIEIHKNGNFDMCNWASNSMAVLQSIPEEKRALGNVKLTPDVPMKEKTLGMMWQPSTDTLSFNLSMNRVPEQVSSGQERPSKRQMLAVIMSIFDPIGLLSPFMIRGKILLQEVWRSKIQWDEKLVDSDYQKWQLWLSELRRIKECVIPRCYISRTDEAFIQLHTFCDSSSKAYATACYLRFAYANGEVKVVLVAAKARVTPLKPCSIPRLELQAALLGARLAHTVNKEHNIQINEKFYWSDSVTTLAWIRSDPRNYKTFVSHRLSAIDDLTMVPQWRWVPTKSNCADIPTRDSAPLDLTLDGPWFSGPEFLKKPIEEWPVEKTRIVPTREATCEEKQERVLVVRQREYSLPDITAFSSWTRLIRATAYVFLFIDKCRGSVHKNLTLEHLNRAEKVWIKKVQEDCFAQEILCLQKNNDLPSDSNILQLSPVLDDEGLMRLGGRIDRAPGIPVELKRPLILSGSHLYTKLLASKYHKQQNHGSTETVVNEIRQKYWITNMRSTIRSVAHNCQFCRNRRAAPLQPPMGDLPLARLEHHKRPFSFCGLDYFGPMLVTIGRRTEKRWGALFTCMVTRAVHMEIAASLTTDAAIMAIRRMIARRGCPTAIYSDNGTNFKGADVELKKAFLELNQDAISADMLNRGIEWHYIPATAAHMGGAWERLVQSIKKALKVTLHGRAPREEVLATLMTEAEHTVNSRPLTFVSVDPRDPEALTPNHFLIGTSSGAPLFGKFDDKDLMLRKQWRAAQRLADIFWSRWVIEYLPTLLDRKMKGRDSEVKEGQVVIIVDNNLPRNIWPRGIISKTFPGRDGKVRVVEVKTAGGSFRRPLNKIISLNTSGPT